MKKELRDHLLQLYEGKKQDINQSAKKPKYSEDSSSYWHSEHSIVIFDVNLGCWVRDGNAIYYLVLCSKRNLYS
jgi:hypothetical protein